MKLLKTIHSLIIEGAPGGAESTLIRIVAAPRRRIELQFNYFRKAHDGGGHLKHFSLQVPGFAAPQFGKMLGVVCRKRSKYEDCRIYKTELLPELVNITLCIAASYIAKGDASNAKIYVQFAAGADEHSENVIMSDEAAKELSEFLCSHQSREPQYVVIVKRIEETEGEIS